MDDLALLPEMDGPYDSSADAFYEEIEAPKFVDLTDKDPVRVDDRYWFCSRVGCDQNHEEELDSEVVYKNFVLRVMAARSPNVRLQKALSRRCGPVTKVKCPQSAPPKSTRPQVSRLALVASSMATQMDGLKSKCIEQGTKKASKTPNPKVKVVGAKYMTTPRNKNPEPKHDAFRSAQNPKGGGGGCVGEVKSRVAKALVFHSPKKTVKLKASLELKTPVRKICEKLKKLELDEEKRKKRVLGYSSNPIAPSASKPKATPNRPWRADKKVAVVENKKRKDMFQQPCDKVSINSDENQVTENGRQVGEQEVLLDAKPVEEHQSALMVLENVTVKSDEDKENEAGTDQNRCTSKAKPEDARSAGRKVPNSENASKKFLKVMKPAVNPKEGNGADVQGLKYRKPKPTNPKPFRLRTDERRILKEANSEKRVLAIGKCHGETQTATDIGSKPACEKILKLKANAVKDVQEKPTLASMVKPSIASTTPFECSKATSAAKTTTKTPEKPKSILLSSSTKRKTATPNRENITRKPTVSFLIPGEKTPEVSTVKECDKLKKVSSKKSPGRERSQTPKNLPCAWRLP